MKLRNVLLLLIQVMCISQRHLLRRIILVNITTLLSKFSPVSSYNL